MSLYATSAFSSNKKQKKTAEFISKIKIEQHMHVKRNRNIEKLSFSEALQ